jgi:hypothetical protein
MLLTFLSSLGSLSQVGLARGAQAGAQTRTIEKFIKRNEYPKRRGAYASSGRPRDVQIAELVGAHELNCRWLHLKGLDAANISRT